MEDFYRIEDKDGSGPYRLEVIGTNRPHHWMTDISTQEMPEQSGIHGVMDYEVFGFASMDKLHSWFKSDQLIDLGSGWRQERWQFRLSHYKVPTEFIRHGRDKIQSVANRTALVRVSTFDLLEVASGTQERRQAPSPDFRLNPDDQERILRLPEPVFA